MRAPTVSKPLIQPRVQGRNPARFKGGYGVPRGFKGEKSKSPPNPLGLAERVLRPQAVEGVAVEDIHDHGTGEMGSESSVPKRMARITSMAILGSRRMDSKPFVSCMTSVNCV